MLLQHKGSAAHKTKTFKKENKKMMNEKKKLITTDFDGTLTTHDTLLLFIRYAKGTKAFYKGFIAHLWLLVLMKLGWKSNEKVKEQLVFLVIFKGTDINEFNEI